MVIGDLLKQKRESLGISARGLSVQVGMSPSYVSKVEAGELDPTLHCFARMASALKMNHYEIAACLAVALQDDGGTV